MYKGASQNLQRRADKAFIMGGNEPDDALPDVSTLSFEEAQAERDQLRIELARIDAEIAAAKVARELRSARNLGPLKNTLQLRLSAVKRHLFALDPPREELLRRAIKDVFGQEGYDKANTRFSALLAEARRAS